MTDIIRQNCKDKLNTLINNEDISNSIEESVYQWSTEMIENKNQYPNFDNKNFKRFYMQKLISLYTNLKDDSYVKNSNLLDKISNNDLYSSNIAFLSSQELFPEKWKSLLERKSAKEEIVYSNKLEVTTDQYFCYRCKKNRCSYYFLQTRSSDEPTTCFITCLNCGNKWKICN